MMTLYAAPGACSLAARPAVRKALKQEGLD